MRVLLFIGLLCIQTSSFAYGPGDEESALAATEAEPPPANNLDILLLDLQKTGLSVPPAKNKYPTDEEVLPYFSVITGLNSASATQTWSSLDEDTQFVMKLFVAAWNEVTENRFCPGDLCTNIEQEQMAQDLYDNFKKRYGWNPEGEIAFLLDNKPSIKFTVVAMGLLGLLAGVSYYAQDCSLPGAFLGQCIPHSLLKGAGFGFITLKISGLLARSATELRALKTLGCAGYGKRFIRGCRRFFCLAPTLDEQMKDLSSLTLRLIIILRQNPKIQRALDTEEV